MADANGPVPYFNQAILLQPLVSADDPTLDHLAAFYGGASGRMRTLLSLWPTPDLASRGWSLVGHPAFMVRGAFPASFEPGEGVAVHTAATSDDLHEAERIAVEGYPLDEARGLPPGRLFPDALLDTDVRFRIGRLDGEGGRRGGVPRGSRRGQSVLRRDAAPSPPPRRVGSARVGTGRRRAFVAGRRVHRATTADPGSSAWASCPRSDSRCGPRATELRVAR